MTVQRQNNTCHFSHVKGSTLPITPYYSYLDAHFANIALFLHETLVRSKLECAASLWDSTKTLAL